MDLAAVGAAISQAIRVMAVDMGVVMAAVDSGVGDMAAAADLAKDF